ncbi:uncharacterized protein Z520_05771 [Fonsecaea multimorphosa CBS 102226]|uniref:Uncharacterized protein n=1 Tax=Fonsecaea multimorphosa CBS 102226 TaxID=1442371 RepID=A0A0D2H9E9_9EURO|nr:uncharacterized protein Z520_05771 [Fonsecaea multimorphosa CBS 102226]KIX98470.1 hypothetical protein Z520_05771 [Fonsecaea multimorphosa CBS 102226]OAL24666.1 hypothetical protein AYO22_05455 [Fonsecaea multimorphosa]
MPLEEISPNIQKDGPQNGAKQDETAPGTSTTSLTSSAVQSMLRNTTELGDSGPFAVRPPRIPRSGSRPQSSKRRAGSFDTSFNPQLEHQRLPRRRSHRHHGPRPVPSSSALSGRETIHSTQTSLRSGFRPKRAGPRHRSSHVAGPRVPAHPLHSHRSLITLRSHRDFHSLHSSSPMIVSGHRRRPGYRASSPALSEAYPYRYGARHGYPRVGSVGTVASSPVSTHHLRPGPPVYPPELNNSMSSFVRLPSPAVSSLNGFPVNAYPHPRTTTPMSNSLQSFRPVWNHSAASSRGLPQSPTGSTAPHYYDYSESFLEEDCFSPPNDPSVANLPFNMDQTILGNLPAPERRQAQSPFGTVPGSAFHPLELPTVHNRQPSEQSKQSKYSYAGNIPPRKSSLGATTAPSVTERLPPADQDYLDGRSKDEKDNPRASTASRRTCASDHSSAFFPNATRSPRDLTTLAARVHSPVFDHKPSISGLMEYGDRKCDGNPQTAFSDIQRARSHWELPSFSFRPLSFGSYSPELKERPKTSGGIGSKERPEILSPMPERPMSSQSRKRFSRILEIPDNYVTDRGDAPHHVQTFSRLDAVEEHPDLQSLERVLSPQLQDGSKLDVAEQQDPWENAASEQAVPNVTGDASQITIHEISTIESLLDGHIECLGLNDDGTEGEDGRSQSDSPCQHSVAAPDSSGESTIRAPSSMPRILSPWNLRPTTSSSTIRHSSLTSSERRQLVPRRLFASMDARLPPGAILQDCQVNSTSVLSSSSSRNRGNSSGWQTLQSTSGLLASESTKSNRSIAKCSLTSGDMADIDSHPSKTRFKVRRFSELSLSPGTVNGLPSRGGTHAHRRSKSDMLARQESHQRRRARILMKSKRKSQSVRQLGVPEQTGQLLDDGDREEEWTTEDWPEKMSETAPAPGYAELSADSVTALPPTTISEVSVLAPTSMPRRWTSMLAAMPEPVKKSLEMVRKASVRTVHSRRSNTSVIEPLNSTRCSSQIPRLGSIPQLAPPELGPPLTSSELNLSLRFPDQSQTLSRPPLREVQSFFSDDSTTALAQKQPTTTRKKFDLHSLRSGFTKSSGLLGTRHSSTQHETSTLRLCNSYHMKTQQSFEYPHPDLGDTVPTSNFPCKHRNMLDRVKGWWRRRCMPKTLTLIRKRSERNK